MKYKPFTLKAAVELAAPPTWVASVGPCLVAGALALCCALLTALLPAGEATGPLTQLAVVLDVRSAVCWVFMLVCSVLMQSATNSLNDYQDFMSGLDTADTVLDETDASLVYNQIDPKNARTFAIALLAVAVVLGVAIVIMSSLVLLILGLIAAATLVLYSFGPKPISSLPIGEAVSGVVMGGVIVCASFYAMTLSFSPYVVAIALVPVVSIAQIMQTNNTCDIARDLAVGRSTFPGIIGAERSRILNGALSVFSFVWLAGILAWAELYAGAAVALLGFAVCLPKTSRLLKGPYDLINRRVMMQTVVSYNRWLMLTTAVALILGGALRVLI